jgi:hypothetical protein
VIVGLSGGCDLLLLHNITTVSLAQEKTEIQNVKDDF